MPKSTSRHSGQIRKQIGNRKLTVLCSLAQETVSSTKSHGWLLSGILWQLSTLGRRRPLALAALVRSNQSRLARVPQTTQANVLLRIELSHLSSAVVPQLSQIRQGALEGRQSEGEGSQQALPRPNDRHDARGGTHKRPQAHLDGHSSVRGAVKSQSGRNTGGIDVNLYVSLPFDLFST